MKNIKMVIGLVIGVFVIGIAMGIGIHKTVIKNTTNNNVEVKRVITESTNDFKLNPGQKATELTDGSFTIENKNTNEYAFTPACMGDWDLKAKDKTELDKMVKCYIENTNNLNKTTKEPLKIVKTLDKSTEDVKLDTNDIYTQYNNGCWTIVNDKNNMYELSIPQMGDWTYCFDNAKDFNNCLATYTSIHNTGSY